MDEIVLRKGGKMVYLWVPRLVPTHKLKWISRKLLLTEKVLLLEHVPLPLFLGPEHRHIRVLTDRFPKCRITVRGQEVRIQGAETDIRQASEAIRAIAHHCQTHTTLSEKQLHHMLETETPPLLSKTEKHLLLHAHQGQKVYAKTPHQQAFTQAILNKDLVFAIGPAGTGKTFLAVTMAVRALKEKSVQKIIITRPAVEAGESLGFLPGDLKEKLDPYLMPIYDALELLLSREKLNYYREQGVIEIAPLAYMRGRTLSQAFVVLDEAQNTTSTQMKMFLTRLGSNSKMVVTGDISQIDLSNGKVSGLVESVKLLSSLPNMAICYLDQQDVTRHHLVRQIIRAYEKIEKK